MSTETPTETLLRGKNITDAQFQTAVVFDCISVDTGRFVRIGPFHSDCPKVPANGSDWEIVSQAEQTFVRRVGR